MKVDASFDWDVLVSLVVHPAQVAIIEAMMWVRVPLSATDLRKLFDDDSFYLSLLAYHLTKLHKIGALEVECERPVRGVREKFYSVSGTMVH